MTTSALVSAYEHEAREIRGLPTDIIYMPDSIEVRTGLRSFMQNGIAYIQGAPSYTVTRRIALHEFGHLWHFMHRDAQNAFWSARFGACVSAPRSWDDAYADAHQTGVELWPVLPGETIAECFAVAVEGAGQERTLDYGCAVDALAMRAFFGGGEAVGITTSLGAEWHGPIPATNYTAGRNGQSVDTILLHTMVGWISGADARFRQQGSQVSAHYGVRIDGALWQWVDERDGAYHAGNYDVNLRSLGIEHEDGGDYEGVRPDELYGTSALLVAELCRKYGVPCVRGTGGPGIYDHRQVHATACPDALDTDRIIAAAAAIVGGGDMTKDEVIAIVKDYLANVYGPALEAELAQKQQDAIAGAVKATGEKLTKP